MLLGRLSNTLAVDLKGRIVVPIRVRESAGGRESESLDFHVGCLSDKCLYLHTEDQHRNFLDIFENMVSNTQSDRMLKTLVSSSFVPVATDKGNRVTVPSFLLERAGIKPKEDVIVVGMRDRVEIWNKGIHAALMTEHEVDFSKSLEAAWERASQSDRRQDDRGAEDND